MLHYTIHGNDMQLVELAIDASHGIRAEVGTMMYMGSSIKMDTTMGGSIMGAAKRYLTGEGVHITSFRHNGPGSGVVAFGAPYPGRIIPLDLASLGGTFLCQKDSFLCCESDTYVDIAFVKKNRLRIVWWRGIHSAASCGKWNGLRPCWWDCDSSNTGDWGNAFV